MRLVRFRWRRLRVVQLPGPLGRLLPFHPLPLVGEPFGLLLSRGRRRDLWHLPKIDHIRFRFQRGLFLGPEVKKGEYGDVQEKGEPDQIQKDFFY